MRVVALIAIVILTTSVESKARLLGDDTPVKDQDCT